MFFQRTFTCCEARKEDEGEAHVNCSVFKFSTCCLLVDKFCSELEIFLRSPDPGLRMIEPGLDEGSLGGSGGGCSVIFINHYWLDDRIITKVSTLG